MAEDVHVHQTPPAGDGGGAGWVAALLIVIVLLAVVWFAFLRGGTGTTNVPDQIQIDVNTPEAPAAPRSP
jgi:hypothetical protein